MLAPGLGVAKVGSGFTHWQKPTDSNVELNVISLTSDLCISVRAGPVAIGGEHTHTWQQLCQRVTRVDSVIPWTFTSPGGTRVSTQTTTAAQLPAPRPETSRLDL